MKHDVLLAVACSNAGLQKKKMKANADLALQPADLSLSIGSNVPIVIGGQLKGSAEHPLPLARAVLASWGWSGARPNSLIAKAGVREEGFGL